MKLLVVEDDELNAYALTAVLTNQNYAVEVASDGETAWELIQTYNYDLILLDVVLPKLDGISLCRQIRSSGLQMPILLLTGRDSSHEKAIGLDAGADDYVVKPFEEEELVARVRALLRRGGTTSQPILEWGNLRLDPSSCEVTFGENLLSLTPKEYALLELFLRNSRRVFSCGMILEHLWSYEDTPGEEAVRTHIKGLRQRLKAVGAPSDLIETVYGIGYRLKPQEEEKTPAKNSIGEKTANSKSKNHKTKEEKSPQQQTLKAIAGVWQKFQGRVNEQVQLLEKVAFSEQTVNSELLTQAQKEAHTLAGSLGTFGFPTGSKLARKIEQLLKSEGKFTPEERVNLQTWVKSLRQEIQSQNPDAGLSSVNHHQMPLVLVVDRDETLAKQLAQTEFKIAIATNLQSARNLLYREHPSAVLLDPSFSEHPEDSLSFFAELAQRKPPVPVLVLTEQTNFSNRLQLARQGGHIFLQKPMTTAKVGEAIAQLLQQPTQSEAKILAVDDDPKILALLQNLLTPWGLQVISLEEPLHFWETLETVKPDLLILDVEMPHSNGIELCQVVRNDPNWSELPILFLTVHSDADIVNQVYSVGADDFVSKPIVGPELVTRIINRLERMKLLKHMAQTHQPQIKDESTFLADWRTIFEGEPECVKIVAADGTLLEMNPAGLAIIEANSKTKVIGKSVYSLIAPEYQQAFREFHERICQGNKGTLEFEMITCQGNRRWMETHAVPLHNKVDGKFVQLAITRDITHYKQVETEIRRINRTLQTLSNCNQIIVRTQDEQDLLEKICQIIVEVGGYRLAWVGFAEHDTQKNIRPVAQAGYDDGYLQTLQLTWSDTIHGRSSTGTAIRTGQTCIIQNILTDPQHEIWRCQAQQRGYAAAIALPLKTNQQVFGALNIYAAEPNAFDDDEVQLLKKLAEDLTYGIVALRNQRDRALAQAALQQSEASYTQLIELCPEAIFIQSEGKFAFLNSAAVKLFGATQSAELLGKPVLELVHPNFQALVQQRLQSLQEYKQPLPLVEEEFIGLNGEIIHLEVVAAPCEYQQKPAAVVVARNISHRKHTEAALQKANNELELRVAERTAELINVNRQLHSELEERQRVEEQLRVSQEKFVRILDIADDAIISINSNQGITLFNQGAEKIFGYAAPEVIGKKLDILLPLRFTQAHRQHVSDFGKSPSLARRMGERRELFGLRKDGSEFPAEASISKLHMGEEVYYTVILRDVTERKQIERMKDEFVSVVSHELRTPLTSIHGSLGMLSSGFLQPNSEQGKRLLQIATDSTERLVRLINDILDIERIESGKVKMARELCNLADLIESAVNIIQPLANKQDITLSISDLSVRLWADPDRIVQTLTNLLSNAIKFSSPGETVWLETQLQQDEVLITIKDTGRGIPEDKLESIFERFQQVDSSDSRNHDGTGLGLAICKSIIQQHNGRIWAESNLGTGSKFYFTLPIQKALQIADAPNSHQHTAHSEKWQQESFSEQTSPKGRREARTVTHHSPLVLVCDDDLAICHELQTLLQQGGYRVITVGTGEDAIAIASSQQPDVILLDLLMPGMNGWQTMAVLKERADTKQIPIVICSVYKTNTNNQPMTDVADWVSKPVQESYLLQSLKQVVATPCKRARILIVEDDNDLAQLLTTLFERHDIETCLARTGREAIQLSQQLHPDLLILDLILPESDGFVVVDWLKQHNRLCHMPVVVYSAKDLDESERQRLKLGHTEFLTKGRVTTQEFEQRVMELLQRITHKPAQGSEHEQTDSSGR